MPREPTSAARLDEMSGRRLSLRVTLQPDFDVTVAIEFDGMPIEDEEGNRSLVEFCAIAGGGGQSPRTLRALNELFRSLGADNEDDPTGIPPFPINLRKELEKAPTGPLGFYERRYYPFSNFSSFAVEWRGRVWMTSEHAYQAAKFFDEEVIQLVFEARSAHDAKIVAHQHKDRVRPDWNEVKVPIMKEICRAKLSQHAFIEKRLRETTGRVIVEDSPRDSFWGWGPDRNGLNHLGKIYMELRDELPAV